MKKIERVFQQIAREREYQNGLPHHSHAIDESTSVAAWIIYMEKHIQIAKDKIYHLDGVGALGEVRKVAALGVACMQHNPTPDRER